MLTLLEKDLMLKTICFQEKVENMYENFDKLSDEFEEKIKNSHITKIPKTTSCEEVVELEYANTKIEIMFNSPYSDQQEGEDPNEIFLDLSRNGKDGSTAVTLSKEEAMELAEILLKFALTKKI